MYVAFGISFERGLLGAGRGVGGSHEMFMREVVLMRNEMNMHCFRGIYVNGELWIHGMNISMRTPRLDFFLRLSSSYTSSLRYNFLAEHFWSSLLSLHRQEDRWWCFALWWSRPRWLIPLRGLSRLCVASFWSLTALRCRGLDW
jgi:hypothetical protein